MKRRNGALLLVLAANLVVVSCAGGLPPSLQREINAENRQFESAEQTVQHSQTVLTQDLAQAPDLFASASELAQWTADAIQQFPKSPRRNAPSKRSYTQETRLKRAVLFAEERTLRESALSSAKEAESGVTKWLAFRQNLPASLDTMNREYQTIHNADLTPVAKTIAQAEKDWPAKASYLDGRLAALRALPQSADTEWASIDTAREDAAAGKATGKEVATLIETDAVLAQQAQDSHKAPAELGGSLSPSSTTAGTKYSPTSTNLTTAAIPFIANASKPSASTTPTSPPRKPKRTVKNTGPTSPKPRFMRLKTIWAWRSPTKTPATSIAKHKPVPQPPGYSYIAPPEVGSNQYGRWTNDSDGHSVWTWLPEYLILRELLWNHSYQPVVMGDYSAYRMAQRSGTSYYGQRTPDAPPKFGTHGTFTQSHYAGSRYMQSGGGFSSAYASSGGPAAQPRSAPSFGSRNSNGAAGKRFGRQAGSPSMGQRFGRPSGGGFRPSGRGFGRRR